MADKQVRVMRILEFTYESVEAYESDRKHWQIQEGVYSFNNRQTIRAAILPLETLAAEVVVADG